MYTYVHICIIRFQLQKNGEIASLSERLNQSAVVITDLQQEKKHLKKDIKLLKYNTSSLLLTAKQEIDRKMREINFLREKYIPIYFCKLIVHNSHTYFRMDNKSFRRPNYFSVGVQTDDTIHPSFKSFISNENKVDETRIAKTITKPDDEPIQKTFNTTVHKPIVKRCERINPFKDVDVKVDKTFDKPIEMAIDEPVDQPIDKLVDKPVTKMCAQRNHLPDDELSAADNVRSDLHNYHIPKKNPSARRFDITDTTTVSSNVCFDERLQDPRLDVENQQKKGSCDKKYHIPKKDPIARRLDIAEVVSDYTHRYRSRERHTSRALHDNVRCDRRNNPNTNSEKPSFYRRKCDKETSSKININEREHGRKYHRMHCRVSHSSNRRYGREQYSDKQKLDRSCSRGRRKQSGDRNTSDEKERFVKLKYQSKYE